MSKNTFCEKVNRIYVIPEEWRDIEDFYPYQVSSGGRIRSVDRLVNTKLSKQRMCKGRILSQYYSRGGYPIVYMSKSKKLKVKDTHRLAAQAFIPNPENKKWVNHKNGIKWDNRVENLEWVTPSENRKHAIKIGIQDDRGERSKNSKVKSSDVILMRKLWLEGISVKEIASIYTILHPDYIRLIINKRRWKHI